MTRHPALSLLLAAALVASGCGSSDPEPASPAATPEPEHGHDEEAQHRFEPGHSKAVRDYYGDPHDHEPSEFGFGETEADYHQPPRPAAGGIGDTITLTGTNLGIRLRVTVTRLSRAGRHLAVHATLRNTGVAIFESRLEDARVTYDGGRRARAVMGVKAPCSNGFQGSLRIEPEAGQRGCLLFSRPSGARPQTLHLSLEEVPVAAGGRWTLR